MESLVQKNAELIALARFDKQGTSTYPDAALTLRHSYGQVKGWDEPDHRVAAFTTVGVAFERDTGVEPFALPASWRRAKSRLGKTRPMNFVTTNDITGGNSGSPMLNRRAEIIGLAFDTNIHAMGGAYWTGQGNQRSLTAARAGSFTASHAGRRRERRQHGQGVGGHEEAELALDDAALGLGLAVRLLPQLDIAQQLT